MAAVLESVRVDQVPSIVGASSDVVKAARRLLVLKSELPAERKVQNLLIAIHAQLQGAIVESPRNLRVAVIEEGEPKEPWFIAYLVGHSRFSGDGESRDAAVDALVAHMVNDLLTYQTAAKLTLDAQEAHRVLRSMLKIRQTH